MSIRPLAKNLCRKKSFFGAGDLLASLGSRIKIGQNCPWLRCSSVTQPAALCRHFRSALRAAFLAGYVASSILVRVLPQEISTRSFRQIFLAKGLEVGPDGWR